MIRLNGVTRCFGDNVVLDAIDLNFEKGTINTIIAPNGTGKTTLLSIVAGYMDPNQGKVDYGSCCSSKDVVLLLPGERNLYMKNTVYENVFFFGILAGLSKKQIKERINKYKAIFPIYEEVKDNVIEKLSYGQKRLIALFSAIVMEAKCIMIDEVSEGLDLANINLLQRVLDEIKNDKIIILASQDYSFVANVSDNLYFLKNGKIIQKIQGTSESELIMIYQNLYLDGKKNENNK